MKKGERNPPEERMAISIRRLKGRETAVAPTRSTARGMLQLRARFDEVHERRCPAVGETVVREVEVRDFAMSREQVRGAAARAMQQTKPFSPLLRLLVYSWRRGWL